LKPIEDAESKLFSEHRKALEEYNNLSEEDKKGKHPPVLMQRLMNDFTNEALLSVHSKNLNGIGVYKDELMGWLNEMNRYRSGGDEQFWISNFSGKSITVNRKSGDDFRIDSPYISVIGTVQPGILDQIFTNEKTANGFTDRIVFSYPDKLSLSKWTEEEIGSELVDDYIQIIEKILNMNVSDDKSIRTKTIRLSKEAKEIFKEFYNNMQAERHKKTGDIKVLEYSSKLTSYVIRIALILQVLSWAAEGKRTNDQIDTDSIIGAIKLIEYYKNCYSRIIREVKTKKKEAYTKEEVAKMLNDNGIPFRQIADYFKVGKSTIGDWIKKHKPDNGQRT
jgi:hypothetical protein